MTRPDYIVGIGASAGGLDSLKRLVSTIPVETNLAFVIVQHLNPDHRSLMVELLQRQTEVKVLDAADGDDVQAGKVYIAPAGRALTLEHCTFVLAPLGDQSRGTHPVDIFFLSLARELGSRAVGVILSGSGDDGMIGASAIASAGGLTFAQDLHSAQFDGMPRSAMASGAIDYVMPPEVMVGTITRLLEQRPSTVASVTASGARTQEGIMKVLFSIVHHHTELDLTKYKDRTVLRRIEQRMLATEVASLHEYVALLEQRPEEVIRLYHEILIGVTAFFRDREMWQILEDEVLPELIADKIAVNEPIRVWSAGCSTGDEVYSASMMLHRVMTRTGKWVDFKIFGTDINQSSLDHASAGKYSLELDEQLTEEELRASFNPLSTGYQVKPFLRQTTVFARQNVFQDPPFTSIDLVFCRNLLIYLEGDLQRRTLSKLAFSARVGGVLVLGNSETIEPFGNYFEPISRKWKIYRKTRDIPLSLQIGSAAPTMRRSSSASRVIGPKATAPSFLRQHLDHFYDDLTRDLDVTVLVIDADHSLLYTIGETREVLTLPRGKTSVNIFQMIHPSLSHSLRVAMRRLAKEKEPITLRGLQMHDDGSALCMRVAPIEQKSGSNAAALIYIFEASDVTKRLRELPGAPSVAENDAVAELEYELRFTQESLQATIEELETANEELQATNEELLASNEALQSTNEELQSVNEELHTVNSEYQEKIRQLTALNDDMDNLLRATQIGTIFLDGSLRIRKFTNNIAEWFHLMNQDIGRPIAHFSTQDIAPNIFNLAREVLMTARVHEIDIHPEGRAPMVARLLPFYNSTGKVDGVVITFIDIGQWIHAEKQLRQMISFLPVACALYNPDTSELSYSNELFHDTLGVDSPSRQYTLADALGEDLSLPHTQQFILEVGKIPHEQSETTTLTLERANNQPPLQFLCRRLAPPASGILLIVDPAT